MLFEEIEHVLLGQAQPFLLGGGEGGQRLGGAGMAIGARGTVR